MAIWVMLFLGALTGVCLGQSSVEGIAMDALTGAPLRKAYITIAGAAQGVSGADGRFHIAIAKAGEYSVRAERAGYSDCDRCMTVRVATNQDVTGVRIPLTPYGSISGRVVDADGDPWIWGSVEIYRPSWKRGKRDLDSQDSVEINDRGEFRMGKLPPGPYYIEVDPGRRRYPLPVKYLGTYYPDSLDPAGATRIDLRAGQQLTGIEIKLQSAEPHRISGRITGDNRLKWTILITRISGSIETDTADTFCNIHPDGTFEIGGAIPGAYRLRAGTVVHDEEAHYTATTLTGQAMVTVGAHDVDDVQIEASAPMNLTGSVRVEGAATADWKTSSITLTRDNDFHFARLAPDGSFTLSNIAKAVFHVIVRTPNANQYYVKSPGSSLDLNRAGDAPLEIVLSAKPARIQGTIQADSKPDPSRLTVMLIPDSEDAGKRENDAVEADFDQTGTFSLAGIPPGEYRLFAWQDLPDDAWKDGDFWGAVKDAGVKIKLEEGDQKSIQLPLISPSDTTALLARLDIQ